MATPSSTNQQDQQRTNDQTSAQGKQGRTSGSPEQHEQRAGSPSTQAAQGAQGAQGPQTERQQQVPTSREAGRGGGALARTQRPSGVSPWGAPAGGFGNPFALVQQLQNEMDRIFEGFGLGRGFPSPFASPLGTAPRGLGARGSSTAGGELWAPQLDVFRRGDELVVRADLPGLSKDDVSIEVENDVLTIRGERKQEAHEDRDGYYWNERSYGAFERSVALPDGTDGDQAQASFRDGVLEVTLPAPKAPERRARRVEIR
jgi:HSP20 family protein